MNRLAALFFLTLLSGCAVARESSMESVDIAPGVSLALPDNPPFGLSANVVQLGEAVYKDKVVTFQAVITSTSDLMKVVVTLPSGPRVMSFEWQNGSIKSRLESIAPKGLSAEHMIADMMVMYAPSESLESALRGATLKVAADGSRTISQDKRDIIIVNRPAGPDKNPWNGRSTLENKPFGYLLSVQSVSTEASLAYDTER
jgi:hypothetical protein